MWHGHYWTLRVHLLGRINRQLSATTTRWSQTVVDPKLGQVQLSGRLRTRPGSRHLVLILHGLGGSSQSSYSLRAARAVEAAGLSQLRLDLRGSDLSGEGLYHAGLVSDLDATLESPELAQFEHISVLGYSLGGHLALRHAALGRDPRVKAVACVCPPIDLAASARAFDASSLSVYRWHVLRGLIAMYGAFAKRHPEHLPAPLSQVQKIRHIGDWDSAVVAPLHGFPSAQEYYRQMSAIGVVENVARPTLLVHAAHDPMVPFSTIEKGLQKLPPSVQVVRAERGGHVGFPADLSLGFDAPRGLESQLVAWLRSRATN
jgi:predicted alpha/beta-fold hydrolase